MTEAATPPSSTPSKTFDDVDRKIILPLFLVSIVLLLGLGLGYYVWRDVRSANDAREAESTVSDDVPFAESAPQYETLAIGDTLKWSAETSGDEVVRQAGPFVLRITKKMDGEMVAPIVTVSANGQETVLEGSLVSPSYTHDIALFINKVGSAPVVMLQSFSGGAHCCTEVQLAGFSGGRLTKVSLGSWDGDSIEVPKDLDGDGRADFVMRDNRFLYAFASYASSFAPPLILNVVNGKSVEVSSRKGFRKLYAEMVPDAREACVAGSSGDSRNGACPGYVAAAARTGSLEQAWGQMLQGYDAAQDWTLPTGCLTMWAESCPAGEEVKFKSYPEALLYFLKDSGYIPKGWTPPEMRQVSDPFEDADAPMTMDANATTI